jgi:hypothetical protein
LAEEQLSGLAKPLALAGGVILVFAGIIVFIGGDVRAYINSPLSLRSEQEGVVAVIAGIIALSSYRRLHNPGWGPVLLVLGILTGGLGGILTRLT